MPDGEDEKREQHARLQTFRAPQNLVDLIGDAAGRELLSISAWVRRACVRDLQRNTETTA